MATILLVSSHLQGLNEACDRGLLTGHKISGIKMVLIDGAHHAVDSSEMAFRLTAIGAVKQGG